MRSSPRVRRILEALPDLTDEELREVEAAASQELLDRELRRHEGLLKDMGCIPLYRCPNPEHQRYGLYAEDSKRPGHLTCGCKKGDAELAGYE